MYGMLDRLTGWLVNPAVHTRARSFSISVALILLLLLIVHAVRLPVND
jgi:hypothetical protein